MKQGSSYSEYIFCKDKKGARDCSKEFQLLKILCKHTTSKKTSKTEMEVWESKYKICETIIKHISEESSALQEAVFFHTNKNLPTLGLGALLWSMTWE